MFDLAGDAWDASRDWVFLLGIIGLLWFVAGHVGRWTFRALGVATLIVGAVLIASTHTPAQRQARACADADAHFADQQHVLAEHAYLDALDPHPPSSTGTGFTGTYLEASQLTGRACARAGLQAVLRAQAQESPEPLCRGADRLRTSGRTEEAEAAYIRLLRSSESAAHDCAQMGLDEIDLAAANAEEAAASFDNRVVDRGEEFARRLTRTFGVPVIPGPITWMVLLVGLVLLWRWLEIRNADHDVAAVTLTQVNPGPSGDAPAGADGGAGGSAGSSEPSGLASRLRHRLDQAGMVVPASVPGAAPTVGSLIASNPFADGWIGKAAGALVGLAIPQRGVQLTATPLAPSSSNGAGTTKLGFAVEVHQLRSGDLVFVDKFWGETVDAALDRMAYGVAQELMAQCPNLPRWSYWGDGKGQALYWYQQGLDALALSDDKASGACVKPDVPTAEEHFLRAAAAAPSNAAVKVELAKLAETKDDWLRAIGLYLDVVRQHPHALVARQRLAFALALADRWIVAWESDPEGRRRLRSSLDSCPMVRRLEAPDDTARGSAVINRFEDIASALISDLQTDTRWRRFVWESRRRPFRRAYFCFARHPRSKGRALRRALATSDLAVQARRKTPAASDVDPETLPEKIGQAAKRAYGYQAHYNVACCYALMMKPPPADPELQQRTWQVANDAHAKAAVEQLRLTVQDLDVPFPTGARSWVLADDPDLDALRPHQRFKDWATETFGTVTAGSDAPYDQATADDVWTRLWTLAGDPTSDVARDNLVDALRRLSDRSDDAA